MLTAKGSALIAGSSAPTDMEKVHIKVVRGFMYGGKAQSIGTVVEVPTGLAAELIARGRAAKHDPPKPKPAPRVEAPKDETK